MFLWMPPSGDRAGDVLLADSTIFSTLFGVSESLQNFWHNLARMKMNGITVKGKRISPW